MVPTWVNAPPLFMLIAVHVPLSTASMYASPPYTVSLAPPVRLIPVALGVPTQAPSVPSRITEAGGGGTPPPMSFWNVPVRMKEYTAPFESGVSVIVAVIDPGEPLH